MKRNLLMLSLCLGFVFASASLKAETIAPAVPIDAAPAVFAPQVTASQEAVALASAQAEGPAAAPELKAVSEALTMQATDASRATAAVCTIDGEAAGVQEPLAGFGPSCPGAEANYQLLGDELLGLNVDEQLITDDFAASIDPGPDVPVVVNKSVNSFIKYFQTRGRKYFVRWLGRSQNYMAMLRGIMREHGLPEDLSYIAFIESGLNPTARSRANAVGMWQFIRGTALKYGLRVDWWIDERMDPEKATVAAAKYFTNLYGQFGSWYLAAAGYNAGEGRVLRAMRKHKTEDFWALASYKRPLKRETREYVPKYLAAILIAKDPKNYGFDELESDDVLSYDRVKIAQATDLRIIAEASGTSVEEIKRLNPELLRWFTPPNYPDYEIKIPAGTKTQFEENLSKIPAPQRIAFMQHKVRRGETLAKIAKNYGVNVKPILYLNNFKNAKRVKPGTTIYIPVRDERAARKSGKDVAVVVSNWDFQS